MSKPQDFTIQVPSDDPVKQEKPGDEPDKFEGLQKRMDIKDDAKQGEGEELSEEDQQLKNELEMLVERLKEPDTTLYRPALETLRTLIRTSTSSMTSVPKPLKFLRPHYPELQALYETWAPTEDKSLFADILSVLAMTYSDTQPRGTLRYRLLSASLLPPQSPLADPGSWGHEYVRHLAAELGEEYTAREEEAAGITLPSEDIPPLSGSMDDLRSLAKECATFLLNHNAEPDAVDLLEELEVVDEIVGLVDENNYQRVCQYMIRCVNLLPPPDDVNFLTTAHAIYVQHHKFPEALALAIRLNNPDMIREDFSAPGNPLMKRQLAFLIARAQIPLEWLHPVEDSDTDGEMIEEFPEDLIECLSNAHLSQHFRDFGKELGVLEPKSLEDVYKSHLENTRPGVTTNMDSARANLAGTFVNSFVNAGFGNDKLLVEADEGDSWIYKNKDHGMLSATASLGLCLLWDTDIGLSHVDKYTYSSEENIKAGALLATGILNTGVRTEADAALALLGEYTENKSVPLRSAAFMGLGLAYCGSHREDIIPYILPYVSEETVSMEVSALAALSLGFIFVGSKNGDISSTILQTLLEKQESGDSGLDGKWGKFFALGLALLYLGAQEECDTTIEFLKALDHPISKTVQVLVEACAYAGTGNVLKIQAMLHQCDDHIGVSTDGLPKDEKEEEKDDTFQAFAVLAISLIAMGEEIGAEMSLRQFNHLMHYGEPVIRRAIPLAIALVSASNPQLPILDTLSKYSHDNDLDVALNAIVAMGIVGAGTNNARLGQMLRQLAGYYAKEPDCLFMVRVAQGMVHMGKGTLSLNPFFCDREIMSRPAITGLLAFLTAMSDPKSFILDKYHWMFFFLVPAMSPRFLITLDEELHSVPVTVRVGQAVDVVGQAGKPRTISGFQTHQTPVRLGTTERAELATEEYIPFGHVMEGFVILHKNPGWEKEDKMDL